jgi:transcriptional regulator with XRE-family HTH domain
MNIIDRANAFLKVTKMTQQELAGRLGVHFVSLNRTLHGHSGRDTVILKLDEFLDKHGFPHDLDTTPSKPTEEQ